MIKTILFTGDSLIEGDRRNNNLPLGDGYVRQFAKLYQERGIEPAARFINLGVGGSTSLDLQTNWTEILLSVRPDILVLGVGINDLHSFLALEESRKITAEKYGTTVNELLLEARRILPALQLLLIEPFFLRTRFCCTEGERQRLIALPAYRRILGKMARRHHAGILRAHRLFQRRLRQGTDPTLFAPNDPVHLGTDGNHVMATAILDCFQNRRSKVPGVW